MVVIGVELGDIVHSALLDAAKAMLFCDSVVQGGDAVEAAMRVVEDAEELLSLACNAVGTNPTVADLLRLHHLVAVLSVAAAVLYGAIGDVVKERE